MLGSSKVVTPVKLVPECLNPGTGVKGIYSYSKRLDSGACPALDKGFAGMTQKGISGPFMRSTNP
jgi:hypothetical protein